MLEGGISRWAPEREDYKYSDVTLLYRARTISRKC